MNWAILDYKKMFFFENKEIKERKKDLSIQPNDPAAHFNLGAAYDKAGKLHEAIKEFKETIKLHPNSAEAHFNLGVLYDSVKQGEKAIMHIIKAGNLFGDKNDSVNKMESRRLLKEFYKKFGFKPEGIE
jgi:tetratricopeptide (TPR) repeat protein